MINKNLQAVKKKSISIIMIIIIIFTIINELLINKTYAVTPKRDSNPDNINNIDESLYPGYAALLKGLKSTHQNWTFTLLYTDLEWSDVVNNESVTDHGKNLVSGKTGEWLCTNAECDGHSYDGTSWFCASQTAVAHYLDPRNFLTESAIFQFEALSYIPGIHTEAGVEEILKGTFMSNKKLSDYYENTSYGDKTFSQAIMEAANESKVSPYHLASRIRQEVGKDGSPASSGKQEGYEGYFNFYNIGSTHGSDPVLNGLKYATEKGWDTPQKSITGGANWIGKNYISIGQDSLYLQKWNVSYLNSLYYHQYQANIEAPTTESSTIYNGYKKIFNNDLSNTSFNFIIPMYKHIPVTISRTPSSSTFVSQNAQLNGAAHIRKTPAGDSMGVKNAGYRFLRIELNAEKANGHVWDKVMLTDGTIAYIATQYITEVSLAEISKEAYINTDTELLNGPRITTNGTTAIRQLYKGQNVTIIEQEKYTFDGYKWDKIKLQNGIVGYVPSSLVTEGNYGEKVRITYPTELALRPTPGLSQSPIMYIKNGVIVSRIEKGTEIVNGYYWDKVITGDGLTGYMAREGNGVLWLTPVNAKFILNEENKELKVIPDVKMADLIKEYPNATLVSGTEKLETGAKIKANNKEYTIIKLGDVDGNGEIDIIDLALLKRHLLGTHLENEYKKAGILQSGAQEIDIIDLALLKRQLLGTQNIGLAN